MIWDLFTFPSFNLIQANNSTLHFLGLFSDGNVHSHIDHLKAMIVRAKEEGIKLGLMRPITLWPFPTKAIAEAAKGKKGVLVAEINAGQMIDDVKLAVNCSLPVEHFGRLGGIVPSPEEVVAAIKEKLM